MLSFSTSFLHPSTFREEPIFLPLYSIRSCLFTAGLGELTDDSSLYLDLNLRQNPLLKQTVCESKIVSANSRLRFGSSSAPEKQITEKQRIRKKRQPRTVYVKR